MSCRKAISEWRLWSRKKIKLDYSNLLIDYKRLKKQYPILSREEELATFAKMQNGDKEAFDTLVLSNVLFVIFLVNRLRSAYYLIPLEDAVQIGLCGLIKAIHKFDVNQGFRLCTYAGWHIRQALQLAQPEYITFRNCARKSAQYASAVEGAICASDIQFMTTVNKPMTWDELFPADKTKQPDESYVDNEKIAELKRWLADGLDDREREILKLRIDGSTLQSIGSNIGKTRERVRQIEDAAMNKLRWLAGDRTIRISSRQRKLLAKIQPKDIGTINGL